jgi:hypothetical protein
MPIWVVAAILVLGQQPTPEQVDEYVRSQAISGRQAPELSLVEVLSKSDVELLALYRQAFSDALYGFSCVPATFRGGPVAPRYDRLRQELKDRRTRVRSALAERVGISNIKRIEREIEGEAAIMEAEVHITCIPRDTARARRRYARRVDT